jgi:hypothetical protein
MEKKNTSVFYNALIWGLIIGFASVIYSVILYMLDQGLNQNLTYAGILISLVLLILGTRSFRDAVRDGVLPFGPAFSFGLLAMIISSLIGIIYGILLWTVIDPDILDRMREMQMEKILEKGVPEEAIDQVMATTAKFMKPWVMALSGLFMSVFIGAILAIIVAAIFKRDESKADPVV